MYQERLVLTIIGTFSIITCCGHFAAIQKERLMHLVLLLIAILSKKTAGLSLLILRGVTSASLIVSIRHLAQTNTKFGEFCRLLNETTRVSAWIMAFLIVPVLTLMLIVEGLTIYGTDEPNNFSTILIATGTTFIFLTAFCGVWLTVMRWRAGERVG